jgi:hypothetical protein
MVHDRSVDWAEFYGKLDEALSWMQGERFATREQAPLPRRAPPADRPSHPECLRMPWKRD